MLFVSLLNVTTHTRAIPKARIFALSSGKVDDAANIAFGRDIYVSSARTFLSHVPLWLEQRPCDMSRVQEIVKQKKDAPIFPGVISESTDIAMR